MNNINGNMAGKKYVLSAMVLPFPAEDSKGVFYVERVNLETAKMFVADKNFISAVGHESTAKLISELLKVEIPANRIAVWMKPGDKALCVQFLERVAEGKVLTYDELKKMYDDGKIRFVILERII